MANQQLRIPENVAGAFFVDSTCIDCDTCRQIAPSTFRDNDEQSFVYHQPETKEERRLAQMAVVACPTGSIGAGELLDAKAGVAAFPHRIAENVYYCGFNSEKSFGGWSYLIVRPPEKGGNVLIDSPRYSGQLVSKIEEMGGISLIFLSHRDDIADHDRYAQKFNAARIMHKTDGAAALGIENIIEGNDVVKLDDELTVIPVPGHTRGSQVLLYRDKFLFTGDHLAWSPNRQSLIAFRDACWYSWKAQTSSMAKLLDYEFEWGLPGHGRIVNLPKQEMSTHLEECIEWMKQA